MPLCVEKSNFVSLARRDLNDYGQACENVGVLIQSCRKGMVSEQGGRTATHEF
jgi:hypothetical protein